MEDLKEKENKILLGVCYRISSLIGIPPFVIRILVILLLFYYPLLVISLYLLLFFLLNKKEVIFKPKSNPYLRMAILLALYKSGKFDSKENLITESTKVFASTFSDSNNKVSNIIKELSQELNLLRKEGLINCNTDKIILSEKGKLFVEDYLEKRRRIMGK
ncbi:MAG: PspC domain-containing protein [Candidatus Micrarchaeia archaeon]